VLTAARTTSAVIFQPRRLDDRDECGGAGADGNKLKFDVGGCQQTRDRPPRRSPVARRSDHLRRQGNFILQTGRSSEIMGIAEKGHDYFVRITDARPDTGGPRGATPSEAMTWGESTPNSSRHNRPLTDSTITIRVLALLEWLAHARSSGSADQHRRWCATCWGLPQCQPAPTRGSLRRRQLIVAARRMGGLYFGVGDWWA
jgi:hypothetical protein